MATRKELAIGRAASQSFVTNVRRGDIIRWGFLVADGFDIGFAVRAPRAASGKVEEIQPTARVTADMGSLRAEADGQVELLFDNSFSILRGKTVRLTVLPGPAELTLEAVRADGIFDSETTHALVMFAIDLFFSNRFQEAERFFAAFADTVPIFSLSLAAIAFLRGVMTWEAGELAAAQERLKATQKLCQSIMPQDSMWGGLFGGGAASGGVTPAQVDATVICGEATLLSGLLYLTEESLMGIVRFAMGVRSGWKYFVQSDRLTGQIVSSITGGPSLVPGVALAAPAAAAGGPPPSAAAATSAVPAGGAGVVAGVAGAGSASVDAATAAGSISLGSAGPAAAAGTAGPGAPAAPSRLLPPSFSTAPQDVYATEGCATFPRLNRHSLGGILFGMGTFNCVASVLPPVAVRVIAALGFPCDRDAGLQQLRQCLQLWGVRSPLAALFLLVMRVLFPSFCSSDISDNLPEAEAVLSVVGAKYPDSALFLWMAGRLARMQGNVPLARARLARCATLEWVQFAQLCDYEIAWTHAFSFEWGAVQALFARLRSENEWSKAFYTFMEGAALLQQGNVGAARVAFKRSIRLAGRRLGGKVISAEQYSLRRAAEFVALTTVEPADLASAGVVDDVPDEAAVPAATLATLPKLRLPAVVPQGSKAHAAVLAYGAPLAGLEAVYLFNGSTQMDGAACRSGIQQVDAVLAAVAAGDVFSAAAPVWQGTAAAAAWGGAVSAWIDERPAEGSAEEESAEEGTAKPAVTAAPAAAPTAHTKSPEAILALLEAAANVSVGSLSSPKVAAPATPVPSSPAPVAAASAAAAPSRLSIRGFMSSLTGSGSGSPVPSPAAPGAAGGDAAAALPAYAVPTQLQPMHTAALGALIRGALCSRIGLVDEAAACYRWVVEALGAARLKRELHVWAYASYELGVLYADGVKAMARRRDAGLPLAHADAAAAGAAGATSAAAGPASYVPLTSHSGVDISTAALFRGLDAKAAASLAKRHMAAARDVREDFHWKLRLHLRVHLTADDLRVATGHKVGRRVLGGAAAAAAGASSGAAAGAAGAGGAASGEEALRMEADLLAAAEGPLGADGVAADDDDLADD